MVLLQTMSSNAFTGLGYGSPISAASAESRALLADDDRMLLEIARGHMEKIRITLDTATDGQEAWDLLRTKTYAIALVDLEMPGVDGFELVQRIRYDARHSGMPVLVVTGRADHARVDRAYALGAHGFVKKPVNWTVLRFRIQDLIRAASIDPLRMPPRQMKA
jgi:DNA-binding response OmpR family regulator